MLRGCTATVAWHLCSTSKLYALRQASVGMVLSRARSRYFSHLAAQAESRLRELSARMNLQPISCQAKLYRFSLRLDSSKCRGSKSVPLIVPYTPSSLPIVTWCKFALNVQRLPNGIRNGYGIALKKTVVKPRHLAKQSCKRKLSLSWCVTT